jgi:hypothetical protein
MSTTTEPSSEDTTPLASIEVYFGELEDPRREGGTDYPLHEVVVLTICAVICGADGFTSIANFGKAKKDWLGQFLDLENGIPSHDTIGRFYWHLDPEGFEKCFLRWMQSACRQAEEEVVAIGWKRALRVLWSPFEQGSPP